MNREKTRYAGFRREELILRDCLAAHRTVLAKERTVLAYLRTSLAFLIGGVSFVQFFDSPVVRGLGWSFVPIAALIAGFGSWNYFATKRSLNMIATRDPDLPTGSELQGHRPKASTVQE